MRRANDHAHKTVAKDTSEEEEKVEEGDKHRGKMVLHPLRTKDAFKALEYFCLVQKRKVADGFWKANCLMFWFYSLTRSDFCLVFISIN